MKTTFPTIFLLLFFPSAVIALSEGKADTIPCDAQFTWVLDSASAEQNVFRFYDQSAGDPATWTWNFGDGNYSEEQNPVHRFFSPGIHTVCLTISGPGTGGSTCTDTVCKNVTTADYFHLGGHLFAGNFPVNNPVSTGDTGIAVLFKVNNREYIPWDTNIFVYLGYYTFPYLLPGKYIVMARLSPGSVNYPNYKTTYYPDAETAGEATLIEITDSGFFHADIHLLRSNTGIPGSPGQGPAIGNPYPLPVSDRLTLPVISGSLHPIALAFFNLTGQLCEEMTLPLFPGLNELRVDVSRYPQGIYFIRVREVSGTILKTIPIIKN